MEDDSVHRFILKTIFEKSADYVTAVCNGKEAMDVLNLDPAYHIILTDIQMPEMDGLELLSLIKGNSTTQTIPVIGFTAGDVNRYRLISKTPFDALVAKPMDFWDLYSLAKKHVTGPLN